MYVRKVLTLVYTTAQRTFFIIIFLQRESVVYIFAVL